MDQCTYRPNHACTPMSCPDCEECLSDHTIVYGLYKFWCPDFDHTYDLVGIFSSEELAQKEKGLREQAEPDDGDSLCDVIEFSIRPIVVDMGMINHLA